MANPERGGMPNDRDDVVFTPYTRTPQSQMESDCSGSHRVDQATYESKRCAPAENKQDPESTKRFVSTKNERPTTWYYANGARGSGIPPPARMVSKRTPVSSDGEEEFWRYKSKPVNECPTCHSIARRKCAAVDSPDPVPTCKRNRDRTESTPPKEIGAGGKLRNHVYC